MAKAAKSTEPADPAAAPVSPPPVPKKKSKAMTIRNRIVGHEMVLASTLVPHPKNPRMHPESQRAAVTAALDEVGFVQEIIVNKRSGYMLNGHLRADIATNKEAMVPVAYVDLDPMEESKMLAALDATGGMALIDEERMSKLIGELNLDSESILSVVLAGLLDEAGAETTKVEANVTPLQTGERPPRVGGDKKSQIKIVLYAPQINQLETALQLSGELNRGKALMKVCQFYIAANMEE